MSGCYNIDGSNFVHLAGLKHFHLGGQKNTNVQKIGFPEIKKNNTAIRGGCYVILDEHLLHLRGLESVTLHNCPFITDNGVSNLLSKTKFVDLYGLNITDRTISRLLSAREVIIEKCKNITAQGILFLVTVDRVEVSYCSGVNHRMFDLSKFQGLVTIDVLDDMYVSFGEGIDSDCDSGTDSNE